MSMPTAHKESADRERLDARAVSAWCLYDWANSAVPTVIGTFVFSAYYTRAVAENVSLGTAQWSWALTASAVVVALASPVLGAIADAAGPRKPWLLVFTLLSALGCAALWFVEPRPAYVLFALVTYGLVSVCFEFGVVFYNAMLPGLVPGKFLGRVSGWGWGLGYAGGLACLSAVLLGFVQTEQPPFGLDREAAEHVRVVGPFTALWFVLFALPLFFLVPDAASRRLGPAAAVRTGLATLLQSLRNIRAYANILRYLVARMIYTDGLNTLFAFGGIYAAGSFGMEIDEVIVFGIALNVTAGAGAALFAWVDDWIGAKRTVLIALAGLTLFGAGVLVVESKTAFWVLAMALGCFVGPAQAASRSLMAGLAPPALRTEMFGLYALSGKATAFMGPLALGALTLAFDSQRAGMASVLVFFVLGGLLLLPVREARPEAGAA